MSLLVDVTVATTILLASFVYLRAWRLGRARGRGPIRTWHLAWLGVGATGLLGALIGPIHSWSEHSLAGHMTQHVILLMAPMALVLARTGTAVLIGLDTHLRSRLLRALHRLPLHQLVSAPYALPAVWALMVTTIAVWHLPPLFDLALSSDLVHALEHTSFLVAAGAYWTVLSGTVGRRSANRGPALFSIFGTMLAGTAFGALLTFADTPWYPAHSRLATASGLDWLADQQMAGLIMWIPPSIVLLAIFLWIAGSWLSDLDRPDAERIRISR